MVPPTHTCFVSFICVGVLPQSESALSHTAVIFAFLLYRTSPQAMLDGRAAVKMQVAIAEKDLDGARARRDRSLGSSDMAAATDVCERRM